MNANAGADDADVEAASGGTNASPPLPPVPQVGPHINEMYIALQYIGFDTQAVRPQLRAEGLTHFVDLQSLKERDIQDIAESFAKRTDNDGRYLFGIRRTRLLIGLIHWVQDFARINKNPIINQYIGEADDFCTALHVASDRADVRKLELDQSDTVSKAADPGKFKD